MEVKWEVRTNRKCWPNIYVVILQASIAPFPPPPIDIMKYALKKHTPLTLNTAYIKSFSAETRTQGRWGLGRRWGHWVYSKDFWRNLALSYAITKLLVTEINSCFCFVSDRGGEEKKRWGDLPIPLLYFSLELEPTENRPPSSDTPPKDRWCFNWTDRYHQGLHGGFFFFKPPAPFPFGTVNVNSCILSQGGKTATKQTGKHQPGPPSSGSPNCKDSKLIQGHEWIRETGNKWYLNEIHPIGSEHQTTKTNEQ